MSPAAAARSSTLGAFILSVIVFCALTYAPAKPFIHHCQLPRGLLQPKLKSLESTTLIHNQEKENRSVYI